MMIYGEEDQRVGGKTEVMDYYLTPVGYPATMRMNDSNPNKIDLESGVGQFSLDCREAPECIIFKKLVQRNAKGETRVVYQKANYSKIYWVEPQRFCDFHYESQLKRQDMLSFFESILLLNLGVFLGDVPTLKPSMIDFTEELHPKSYAREYVNAIQNVE